MSAMYQQCGSIVACDTQCLSLGAGVITHHRGLPSPPPYPPAASRRPSPAPRGTASRQPPPPPALLSCIALLHPFSTVGTR